MAFDDNPKLNFVLTGQTKSINSLGWNVHFGSKADIGTAKSHVRFNPKSGHVRRS
jgi:hypothetical protein